MSSFTVFNKKTSSESVRLAESIGDVRALLRQILSDKPITGAHKELTDAVLEECHKTFVLIFHALYPTPFLKWTCLCDLLARVDKVCFSFYTGIFSEMCCTTDVIVLDEFECISDGFSLHPT